MLITVDTYTFNPRADPCGAGPRTTLNRVVWWFAPLHHAIFGGMRKIWRNWLPKNARLIKIMEVTNYERFL